jgi:YidC/Oxa1 family membrane protein insertase
MWAAFVEVLRAAIFSAAHVCGGSLGGGILLVSAIVRIALLPLTLRFARRARVQQAKVAELKPQVDALQRRYAADPRRAMQEVRALYAKHDIKIFTPTTFWSFAIQSPLLGGLFAAVRGGLGSKVRFLWVADLARPDATLLLGVAALTAWGVSSSASVPGQTSQQNATMMMVAAVGATLVFLWSASAAVALSFGAQSAVSVLQNWILNREAKKAPANA